MNEVVISEVDSVPRRRPQVHDTHVAHTRRVLVTLHWTSRQGWSTACERYRFEVLASDLLATKVVGWHVDGILALDGFPAGGLDRERAKVQLRSHDSPFQTVMRLVRRAIEDELGCVLGSFDAQLILDSHRAWVANGGKGRAL